jgi:hypothetical protein
MKNKQYFFLAIYILIATFLIQIIISDRIKRAGVRFLYSAVGTAVW